MIQRYAFILLTIPLFNTTAHAQVTLSSGDISYVPGESFPEAICSWVAPGPSGADQTWDFSAMTSTANFTSNWVTPTSSNYPAATVAFSSQSVFMFYEATPAVFRHLGTGVGISQLWTIYSDPADEVRYPFSLGSSYTDAFEGWSYFPDGGLGTDSSEISGTLFVEADAYGTLILPWGTVDSEVIRIHKVRATVTDDGTSTEEEYRFYEPGVHHPWLRTYRRTNSWEPTVVEGARYYNPATTDIREERTTLPLSAFFANDHIELSYTAEEAIERIELLSLDGRTLTSLSQFAQGEQRTSLPMPSAVDGVYLARLILSNGASITTRVLVAR